MIEPGVNRPPARVMQTIPPLPGRATAIPIPAIVFPARSALRPRFAFGSRSALGPRTPLAVPVELAARATVTTFAAWTPVTTAIPARAATTGLRRWHFAGDRRAAGKADLPV